MIETSPVPVANGPRSVPLRSACAGTVRQGAFQNPLACVTAAAWDKPRSEGADAPDRVRIRRDTGGATGFNPRMAADFVTPLIKAGVDLLTQALAYARRLLGKKKYEQLLSTTIAELLKEHPDIDQAKARLAAIETTGVAPSPDLFRARSMLKAVESQFKREKKPRKPGKAKKKSAVVKTRRPS